MKKRFFAWLMVFVLILSFFPNSLISRASSPDEQNLFFNVKFYEQKDDGSYKEFPLANVNFDSPFEFMIHKIASTSNENLAPYYKNIGVLKTVSINLETPFSEVGGVDTGIPINYNELTNGVDSSRKTLPFYGRYDTTSLREFYTFGTAPTDSFNPSGDEEPTTYYISIWDYNMVKYFGFGSNSGAVRFMSIFPTYQPEDAEFENNKNHFTLAFLVLPNDEYYPLGKDQIRVYSKVDYHGEDGNVDDFLPQNLAFNFYHRGTPSLSLEKGIVEIDINKVRNDEKQFLYNYTGYNKGATFEYESISSKPLKEYDYIPRLDESFKIDNSVFHNQSYNYFSNYLPFVNFKSGGYSAKAQESFYLVKNESRPPSIDSTNKELVLKSEIFRAVKPTLTVAFGEGFQNTNQKPILRGKVNISFKNELFSKEDKTKTNPLNILYGAEIDTQLNSSYWEPSPFPYSSGYSSHYPYLSFQDAVELDKKVRGDYGYVPSYELEPILQVESFVDPDTNQTINFYGEPEKEGYEYIIHREYEFEPEKNRMDWKIIINKQKAKEKYDIYRKWIYKGRKPSGVELDRPEAGSNNSYSSFGYSNLNISQSDVFKFMVNIAFEPTNEEKILLISPKSIGSESITSNEKYFLFFSKPSSSQKIYHTENYRIELKAEKENDKRINLIITTIEQIKPEVKVIFQDENERPLTNITDLPNDLNVALSLVNGGSELKSKSFTKTDVSSLSSSGEGLKHTFDKMDFDTSYSVKATANENVFEAAIIDESNKSEHKYTVTFKKKAVAPMLPILPTPEPTPTPPVTPTPTPTPDPVSPLPIPAPVLPEPTPIPPVPTIITPEEDIIPLSSVTLVDEPEAEVPVLPDVVIPSDEEIENLDIGLDETPRGSTDIGDNDNPKGNSILAKTGGLMNKFLAAILGLSALLAILFLSFFKKKS